MVPDCVKRTVKADHYTGKKKLCPYYTSTGYFLVRFHDSVRRTSTASTLSYLKVPRALESQDVQTVAHRLWEHTHLFCGTLQYGIAIYKVHGPKPRNWVIQNKQKNECFKYIEDFVLGCIQNYPGLHAAVGLASCFKTNRGGVHLQFCVRILRIWGCWYLWGSWKDPLSWSCTLYFTRLSCWKLSDPPWKLQKYPNPSGSVDLRALALSATFFHLWLLRWDRSLSHSCPGLSESAPGLCSCRLAGLMQEVKAGCWVQMFYVYMSHSPHMKREAGICFTEPQRCFQPH